MTAPEPIRDFAVPTGQATAIPVKDWPQAARQVVSGWNALNGPMAVRVLNAPRYRSLGRIFQRFTLQEVLAVIRWYGGQAWNRRQRAWLGFDNFICEEVFCRKFEECSQAQENTRKIADRLPPTDPRVRDLSRQVAEQLSRDSARKTFDELPAARRDEFFARARKEMIARGVKPHLLAVKAVAARAMELYMNER